MARPRQFDADEVLDKATGVFWAKGYEGAHLSDLLRATGLSKSSLYETFGSKRELYLASLDRYNEQVAAKTAAGLIAKRDCPREGIAAVFDAFIDNITGHDPTRGCFINNSAGEIGPADTEATARLTRGREYLEDAFYEAVVRGQQLDRINRGRDPRALARFLASSLHGLLVTGKSNPGRKVLRDIADTSLTILD